MTTAKAAVMLAAGEPIEVCDLEVEAPHAGEISVRMVASGVCHSDLKLYQAGQQVPKVLGHEAAGVVEEVGAEVTGFAPGDHVIMAAGPQCGHCRFCLNGQWTLCELRGPSYAATQLDGTTRYRLDGQPVFQTACVGAWSELTVGPAISFIKIDPSMPLLQASLIGCAVVTGFGAAANTGQVSDGDVVAVIGCGGVGLSAVQGARLSGAERIIAVDVRDDKLELARKVGATDAVNAASTDAVQAVKELTGGLGVDVALDFVGHSGSVDQVMGMTRLGGRCVFTAPAKEASISMVDLVVNAKTLRGNLLGMSDFQVAYPRLVELYQRGELLLDEMITRTAGLDGINDAFRAIENGDVARTVIKIG